MIKRSLIVLLLIVTAYILYPLAILPPQDNLGNAAAAITADGVTDLGAANLVTSVIVSYRGLDTLGEVTVLFLATAGVGFVLFRKRKSDTADTEVPRQASEFLQTGAIFLWPYIVILGIFIIFHGHISPGGGFQGGVILAMAFLLIMLAFPGKALPEGFRHAMESLSGLAYVGIAIAGLAIAGDFLNTRILPTGQTGSLISAGAIPLISVAIGIKVGAEMVTILAHLRKEEA
ncbi:sodium:proton antiporter [bacterium]|nr:sodium:proton antiporter [bacterium]